MAPVVYGEDEKCRGSVTAPRSKLNRWTSIIENNWFPKAFGLWRVQGRALAFLCFNFLGSPAKMVYTE
jgi:hypothetical protein